MAYHSLGDGLIYLMLAGILRRNGYEPTLFSEAMSALQARFAEPVPVEPLPRTPDAVARTIDRFDATVADFLSLPFREADEDAMRSWASGKVVFTCAKRMPETLKAPERERCGLRLRGGSFLEEMPEETIAVEGMVRFARSLGLKAEAFAPLRRGGPPGDARRVVISPESPDPRKNWHPAGFVELAGRLEGMGFEPVFSVAPSDRERWVDWLNGRFPVADTPSLAELADLLDGARAVVANDSGTGHLASALGLPVLTIFRRPATRFKWQPGWGPVRVVGPRFCFRLAGRRRWRRLLSVDRAVRAFRELMDESCKQERSV